MKPGDEVTLLENTLWKVNGQREGSTFIYPEECVLLATDLPGPAPEHDLESFQFSMIQYKPNMQVFFCRTKDLEGNKKPLPTYNQWFHSPRRSDYKVEMHGYEMVHNYIRDVFKIEPDKCFINADTDLPHIVFHTPVTAENYLIKET